MFSRAISLSILALPILAAATEVRRNDGDCNTGEIKCCNSTMSSSLTTLSVLSSLLGLSLPAIDGLIGLSCTALSIGGLGGNSCSAQPVCCTNNTFGGAISLGCSPINLNL